MTGTDLPGSGFSSLGRVFRTAAASLLCLGFVAACDNDRTADEYLKSAEAQYEAGKLRATVIELKNALRQESTRASLRLMLGKVYLELGDGPAAEVELRLARANGADPAAVIPAQGEAFILQAKTAQALEVLNTEGVTDPLLLARLLTLRGHAETIAGNVGAAEHEYELALKNKPDHIPALVGAARLAMNRADVARTRELTDYAVSLAPNDPELLALVGDVSFLHGEMEASEAAYRKIVARKREDVRTLSAQLGLGRTYIAQAKLKEAVEAINSVLAQTPREPTSNYLRALAAYQAKDYMTARNYTRTALASAPDFGAAHLLAGAVAFALNENETAHRHLTTYLNGKPDNVEARKLLAATQLRIGQAGKAASTLDPAMALAGDDAQLLGLIGQAQARIGNLAEAQRYFERALSQSPSDALMRAQLGMARLALGQIDAGIEDLEEAVRLDPTLKDAQYLVVLTHIRARDFPKALEAAERIQLQNPNDANAYVLAGVAYLGQRNVEEAKNAFRRALLAAPGTRGAAWNLASIATAEKNYDGARNLLKRLLITHPNDLGTLVRLAQVEAVSGRPAAALANLELAIKTSPDAVYPRVALARLHLTRKEPKLALEAVEPLPPAARQQPGVIEVAGRAQLALGQYAPAVRSFEALVRAQPGSPRAYQYLANAYEGLGNLNRAIEIIAQGIEVEPKNALSRFEQARLMARAGRIEDAAKLAEELGAAYPNDRAVADLAGTLALATNRPQDAVAAFARAHELWADTISIVRLARAHLSAGENNEAIQAIGTWVNQYPNNVLARLTYAEAYLIAEMVKEAKAQYAEILKLSPNEPIAHNNFAWLLARDGEIDQAVPHAQRAAELAPDSVPILDTLGFVMYKANRADEAIKALRAAVEKAPDMGGVQFRLAEVLVRAGNRGEARAILRQIVQSPAASSDRDAANKLLGELGG